MKSKYLVRLDDACPTMNAEKWARMEALLDSYNIRPMVGIIPHNEDSNLIHAPADTGFWDKAKAWQNKGWSIALHGYNHSHKSKCGLNGLNPMWERSEFAGLPLEEQKDKIRKGVGIMHSNGIEPKYFFAPSHTFDENTLEAIREASDIRIISDTIATKPYIYKDFIIIPQFGGSCREIKMDGVFTFCFHPNTMKDKDFGLLKDFLEKHRHKFSDFNSLNFANLKKKSLKDKLLSLFYFTSRRLKGLK